jgi:hypothetical protein
MAKVPVPKSTLAKIRIHVPPGCKRKNLSISALDRVTRELAWGTTVEIDGKTLLCRSFKTVDIEGSEFLVLEIGPECYEFLEKVEVKKDAK